MSTGEVGSSYYFSTDHSFSVDLLFAMVAVRADPAAIN